MTTFAPTTAEFSATPYVFSSPESPGLSNQPEQLIHMSQIQKELLAAAGLKLADFTGRPALHQALVRAVNDLPEKAWSELTVKAQDWFNEAADALKAKKAIVEFADFTPEQPAAEPRSRRRAADDEGEKSVKESASVEKLEEGQRVKVTTKRGKVYEGEVVENNKRKEFVAIKGADGEDEIDYDKVESIEVFHGTAGAAAADEPDAGPEVGDEVKFTTKRGKTVSGVITELTAETIVLGKDDDFDLDRIDGDITIIKKGSSAGAAKAEPETRSRTRSEPETTPPADDKRTRSSNPKGVSVGARIRELVAETPDISEEDVGKVLKKEGLEFRDNTLGMIYKDCVFLIAKLRDAGHMKKAK